MVLLIKLKDLKNVLSNIKVTPSLVFILFSLFFFCDQKRLNSSDLSLYICMIFCEIDELWKEKLKNKRDGATCQSCFAGGEIWWQKLAILEQQSNSLLFHFVFQWSIKLLYWPKQNVPWKNPFKMRYSLLKSVPYFKSQKSGSKEIWRLDLKENSLFEGQGWHIWNWS